MIDYETALILGSIAAIAATIFLYIMVLPKRLDGNFSNPILQWLHDYFHFKKLYIESVLRFIFVLASAAIVCYGFFTMLGYVGYGRYKESTFLPGLLLMVLGPVVLRLFYEGTMMFILLVKNVIEINKKLSNKGSNGL